MFWTFLRFRVGVWACFFVFGPADALRLGLGNQTALLWHRTCFLSFWARFGVVPALFVLPTPPRSAPGRGLGNRAIKLWRRTVCFSCYFLFRPVANTLTVAQDCVTPCFLFFGDITSPLPPSLKLWRYFGFCLPVDIFSPTSFPRRSLSAS